MGSLLQTVVWFGWAFICALVTRLGFTRLFRPRLGEAALIAAYGMWLAFLAVGALVVGFSGVKFYGFDANDRWQWVGYFIVFYSPPGLPTAIGAPLVLVADAVWAGSRQVRRLLAGQLSGRTSP